jgi:hypothetical protein
MCRELDELEREDFARLKKVQSKKADRQKAEAVEKTERDAAAELKIQKTGEAISKLSVTPVSSTNVLSGYDAADDEDVVFK